MFYCAWTESLNSYYCGHLLIETIEKCFKLFESNLQFLGIVERIHLSRPSLIFAGKLLSFLAERLALIFKQKY
jgi:hypothetical protein